MKLELPASAISWQTNKSCQAMPTHNYLE